MNDLVFETLSKAICRQHHEAYKLNEGEGGLQSNNKISDNKDLKTFITNHVLIQLT